MKLYSYWRSSCSYRVRIALNLKGIAYDYVAVNLLQKEQQSAAYKALNRVGLVPTLVLPDGRHLPQSGAILQWIDEAYPEPPLLPTDSYEKARVTSWCQTIACEIQPLNNLGITSYLRDELGASPEQGSAWQDRWFERGFSALEAEIAAAPFCHGSEPGMADIYLVPQVFNALRFNYDIAGKHPKIYSVWQACNKLQPFIDAQPENQPDAA